MAAVHPRFPVKVSANGRYIVDRAGAPYFWLGTTQWELFRGYSPQDARTIIEGSARAGFTFIQTKLLGGGVGHGAVAAAREPVTNLAPGAASC